MTLKTNFEYIQQLNNKIQELINRSVTLEKRVKFLENFVEMDYKLNNNPDDGSWENR